MPGVLRSWPAWPEYTKQGCQTLSDPDFIQTKRDIIAEYGEAALTKAWLETCETLKHVTANIALHGRTIIPEYDGDQIISNGFSAEQSQSLRDVGCCIIRQVLKKEEAKQQYSQLQDYIKDNRDQVRGWPESSPSMLMLYDSPTQIKIRTDPRHLVLQKTLNNVWSGYSGDMSPDPLLYTDGVRDRPPGQAFLGLGPHIDAGSLARWSDPAYRKVYHQIFSGHPRSHDNFDLQKRAIADQFRFPGPAHSTVLRTFQGWTALTRTASEEGSIKLYPNIGAVIAYILLRPFFHAPLDSSELMDGSKWAFDADSAWFPGTFKPQSQYLSPTSHPHLRLKECLVDLPRIEAGDTVWWHTDTCHAVDPDHFGKENASVVYIPACPSTPVNRRYVKEQLEAALNGLPPPDQQGSSAVNETTFNGYLGYSALSDEAKRALGFGL